MQAGGLTMQTDVCMWSLGILLRIPRGTPPGLLRLVLHSSICIFSYNGYVCIIDSAFRKEGAVVVCGYSELPIIYWYFQPGQSCGLAAIRISASAGWVCPWCSFYTAASALSSSAAASHGLSQKEAQMAVVKSLQLITPQACLEQDPELHPRGKRRDTGGERWYVCMGGTKCLCLFRFK